MGRKGAQGSPVGTASPERAARKREIAARYRSRPEVREKQRLRMAEKTARRRQWDPPPKATRALGQSAASSSTPPPVERSAASPDPSPSTPSIPAECGDRTDVSSLTPAEQIALTVLAGMAQVRTEETVTPSMIRSSPEPPDHVHLRAESPSRDSSVAAVRNEPMNHPTSDAEYWIEHRNKPLPPYITPETAFQKKMRRELGTVGPLTPVQMAQIQAYRLGPRSANLAKHMKDLKVKLKSAPFLSLARWEGIRSWLDNHLEYDTEWDEDVRRDLADMQQNMTSG
ncbi:hypothetical protein MSAN_02365600 [Mycena sanguinolenta]|uniref:Uncharacterized protein n=1 Tax=Mycena sanguinolenta TaxID=230812 RepID=A0A8H6X629_9AGAR|nr:hypothetical protein MSAN_02365600 [Mycena sanguinolenta]